MTDQPNYDVSDMPNGDPDNHVPAPPKIEADGKAEADEREGKAEMRAQAEVDESDDEAKQTIDEIIEAAVGVSIEAFKRRHPTSYRYIIRRLGDPLEFTIKALKEDELYQQLIANTEEALDIANVVRVIVSVALSVAERLLIAL